jgi:hypothetical protein
VLWGVAQSQYDPLFFFVYLVKWNITMKEKYRSLEFALDKRRKGSFEHF